jgi:hypothetical protein
LWVPNFSVDLFWNFFNEVQTFKVTKSNSEKEFKKGNRNKAGELSVTAKNLDDKYRKEVKNGGPGHLAEWVKSRTSGGSSEAGMKVRMKIVKFYCVDKPTNNEGNDGGRGLLGQAEPVPVVSSLS